MNNRGTQTTFGICANGDNGICCMKDTSLEISALFEVDIIKYKKTTRMIRRHYLKVGSDKTMYVLEEWYLVEKFLNETYVD